ncbi:ATP-dependent RNA helicase DbpA [Thiomicrorhabdus aquaedulcis]|uniref:ATP-dependent RNA helicase DbpA n=1 Tax=Thiomicrorhabdus aquaedulcis TaxID=2211106 RepID=UPI000FDBF8B6|nr:ATP-dependent RNA helicase DbpA [Thiomicrorhabdus aquaedulcis]
MSRTFEHLDLPLSALENLTQLGYEFMTQIQEEALPLALGGHDLIAQAKTGSGKTAAFGIPMLNKVDVKRMDIQGLVICPTRELSNQVAEELRRLARFQPNLKVVVLSGGIALRPQIASLEYGAHIVVGTPGRLQDHIDKGHLNLSHITTLVLDEADRMLEMGFKEAMISIIGDLPKERQTLLFSATFPADIEYISRRFQKNPMQISVESHHSMDTIDQQFYICHHKDKLPGLVKLLNHNAFEHGMIFCNTKALVTEVVDFLNEKGIHAVGLHGDMEQREREQILIRFKHHSVSYLVATDVAARGLDIEALPMVINYELPRNQDTYVHRIGRTGRAGLDGVAITLFTEKERYKLAQLGEFQGHPLSYESIDIVPSARAQRIEPKYITLYISGGRKDKVRRGDVLGALTGEAGIDAQHIGKIDVVEHSTYFAIETPFAAQAVSRLNQGKIKGKKFKVGRVE